MGGLRCITPGDVIASHDAEGHTDVAAGTLQQIIDHIVAARRAWAHA